MSEPTPARRAEDRLRAALRAAIPAAGRHQVTIADDLGVTTKHLCAMLTGRARLTLDWAERIAKVCGYEVVVTVVEPAEPHCCDNCDGIDPASCVNAPTLRDRIADALTREHYRRAHERIESSVEEHCMAFADAVLPVVEAETGALTHLLRKTEDDLHDARAELDKAMQGAALAIKLAGRQAEKDRTRAKQAEAAVQRVRDIAEELAGLAPGDEWSDDMASTVGADVARRFLAALDQPEAAP